MQRCGRRVVLDVPDDYREPGVIALALAPVPSHLAARGPVQTSTEAAARPVPQDGRPLVRGST